MAELTLDGEPIQTHEYFLTISDEQEADYRAIQRAIHCQAFLMLLPEKPLTRTEERIGWRTRKHDDHKHRFAVGWRREQQDREYEAKREADMAACPYVACTCGHHEDGY